MEKEHELEFTEENVLAGHSKKTEKVGTNDDFQMSFFQLNDPVLEQIKEDILRIDINTLTPVEALLKLNEIKQLVGG